MIIESHEIASTQRSIFKIVWEFCADQQPAMTIRQVGSLKIPSKTKTAIVEEQSQIQLF